MKKYTLLFVAFFLAFRGFSGVQSYEFSVYFNSNSFQLEEAAVQTLETVLAQVPKNSEFEIYIQGYTDDIGTNGFNAELSKNRAESVKAYFLRKGLDVRVINMEYYGEQNPVKPNTNDLNRKENRRVTVQLTTIFFKDVLDLEKTLKERTTTTVTINPNQQNVVVGKDGTRILIDPNSFVDAEGNPIAGEVTIELTEALSYDTFISHNLATLSDGQLLVSGGMFQINAITTDGMPLQLREEQTLTVSVPADEIDQGMELFTSEQGDDWVAKDQKVSNQLTLDLPPYPKFEYIREKLPIFVLDSTTFPQEPKLQKMPRPIKIPSEENYNPDVKWYQFLWAGSIKRRAHEDYLAAMDRYEKRRRLYEKRMELYKRNKTALAQSMWEYKKAAAEWRLEFTKDSADFYQSPEYLSVVNDNERRLSLAQTRFNTQVAAWKAIKKEKVEEHAQKMQALGIVDKGLVDSYVMTVSDLKWVNIDKFYDLTAEDAITINIKDSDRSDEKVFMVFTGMKSMLSLYKNDKDFYQAKNVPNDARKAVLAYKVKDGRAYVSYQSVSSKNDSYRLSFKPTTFKELRELLDQLNS